MARRFPNRIFADWTVPYETYHDQKFPFGQVMELPNGSLYRFCRNGATDLVAAKLCQSEVADGESDTLVVATGAAVGGTGLICTNGTTSLTENEFTEGTLTVETAAGLGHIYPIKTNSLAGSGGAITIVFMDGVTVQSVITAGTHAVTILKNPWADVIIGDGPTTALLIGIPQVAIGATMYGWLQTAGFASCLADTTTSAQVIGQGVRSSEDDNGAVAFMDYDEADQANYGHIGWAMHAGVDADFAGIILRID